MSRTAAPTIVPFLIEAIDRCDPTRSNEFKPSVRMRNRAAHRRIVNSLLLYGLAAIAMLFLAAYLT